MLIHQVPKRCKRKSHIFLTGTKTIKDNSKAIVDTYGNKTTQTCIGVKKQSLN